MKWRFDEKIYFLSVLIFAMVSANALRIGILAADFPKRLADVRSKLGGDLMAFICLLGNCIILSKLNSDQLFQQP